MLKINISNSESFDLPLGYDELTLKQYNAISKVKEGDTISFLSALSGMPRETWEQVEIIDIDNIIAPNLQWLSEKFDPLMWPLKGSVNIKGVDYNYPKDIMVCRYGQRLHIESIIESLQQNKLTEYEAASEVISVVMQPIVSADKKYNSEEVEKLTTWCFENCKVIEALPLTSFFLSKHLTYLKLKEKDYLTNLLQKRFRLESNGSASSKSLAHYTLFQRPWVWLWRKFYKWMSTRYTMYNGMNQNQVSIKKD